jgi:hypothetical protein
LVAESALTLPSPRATGEAREMRDDRKREGEKRERPQPDHRMEPLTSLDVV